ncbi:PIG-L deacetylase family protein [Paenibacillus sp.]|uniref:PIG-L deacetylase family protein n=1 Tax=Paenibacillus sp. TaxID=58172 RepID=UPI002812306E|nr:PIG-L deacetylase family protein [Paenibacillus sp.]
MTSLIIASHPDDEILGCGGTARKLIEGGTEVVTILTALGRKEEAHRMKQCTREANRRLGVKEVVHLDFPNLRLEAVPLHRITRELERLIAKYEPDTIFTHHYGDLNRDHQATFQAVLTAARPLPGKKPIDILCFETVSSTEWAQPTGDNVFKPNYFVDIGATIDAKMDALASYDVEMRPFPHPRSYEGVRYLAHVRGMTVGVPYAEAFETIRRTWV